MGFPTGSPYTSTPSQDHKLESQLLRKTEFMHKHQVPIWNGEFGPVYAPPSSPDADTVNTQRYNLLGAQLRIYEKYNIGWSIWTYKDIGMQGMVYADPKGKWMKTLQPFIEKKKKVQADAWGYWPSDEVDGIFGVSPR